VRADPRSPDRGQYAFLQDLVRKVAGDTLSTRERKARHLAAAAWLEGRGAAEEPEAVEVIASHYVDAYRALPDAPDAADLKARACAALTQAGIRSESLAAFVPAIRYYEQALELTEDPRTRADLHERVGTAALNGGDATRLWPNFEAAVEEYRRAGDERGAARATARLGDAAWTDLRLEVALERMEEAYAVLSRGEHDATLADVAASLGRTRFFTGKPDEALAPLEEALRISETLQLPAVFVEALDTKALQLWYQDRREEGRVLMEHSMRAAWEHDLPLSAFRAAQNLATFLDDSERFDDGLALGDEWVGQARRIGYRSWEFKFVCQRIPMLVHLGRWDEALASAAEVDAAEDILPFQGIILELIEVVPVYVHRGDLEGARAQLDRYASWETSQEIQTRTLHGALWALFLLASGDLEPAMKRAMASMETGEGVGAMLALRYAWPVALEAAVRLEAWDDVERLLRVFDELPPAARGARRTAHRHRFGARLAAARGDEGGAAEGFAAGADHYRAARTPLDLGACLLEWGEWLAGRGRGEEALPLLAEARGIFEDLRATPWIERVDRAQGASPAGEVARAGSTTG
jgi:tetratricopeptide (TPR) repeat protein